MVDYFSSDDLEGFDWLIVIFHLLYNLKIAKLHALARPDELQHFQHDSKPPKNARKAN